MKTHKYLVVILIFIFMLQFSAGQAQENSPDDPLAALGTAFTYQGYLDNSGSPANAVCDIRFGLWDAVSGGTQIGSLSTVTNVQVTNGLFTVSVNAGGEFGTSAFTGSARWLAIQARCPAATGSYTSLSPRQAITLVPYAAHADRLDGQHGSYYRSATNINAGTLSTDYFSAYSDLSAEGYLGNAAGDLALNNGTLQSTLNADRLDGQQGSYYQQAIVSGTCAVGSLIRAINSDGSVVCQNDAPLNRTGGPKRNLNLLVDYSPSDDYGQYTSITIGADGLPIISFYDVTDASLVVAHCEQYDCSGTPTLTAVDTGNVGTYSSIAIGTDGLPIISYYDATNGHLKVAHCEDVACATPATITTVDSNSDSGRYSSITVAEDGKPIISYFYMSVAVSVLRVAHCTNNDCTAAPVISTVDPNVTVGLYTSIAVYSPGLAAISYYDAANQDLKYAHCNNFDCSAASYQVVDSTNDVGQYSSLIFGNDGLPIISYYDATSQNLKVAHCLDTSCSAAPSIYTISSSGNVGQYSSITIGSDGLPVISFSNVGQGLRVAHCADIACSRADVTAPLSGTTVEYTAITIGADGLPIVSLYDAVELQLRVMHCASNICFSYYWRR